MRTRGIVVALAAVVVLVMGCGQPVGGGGESGDGSGGSAPIPPDAPGLATPADGALDTGITLTLEWAAASGADSYDLFLSTNDPPTSDSPVATGIAGTTYGASSLSYDTTYYWVVRATNSAGSGDSVIRSFSTGAAPTSPPDEPGSPVPADGALDVDLSLLLDWADTPGAESYDIYFGQDSAPSSATETGLTASEWDVTQALPGGLDPETDYVWYVVARNSAGEETGQVWSFTTRALAPPDAPSGFTATSAGEDQIDLSWSDNSNNESGFEIERKLGSEATSAYQNIASVSANSTSHSDTGLSPNTEYDYRLRAVNDDGESSSIETSASTTAGQFIHVSHGGSDTSGTGSATAPYATIAHALSQTTAGSDQEVRVAGSDTGEVYAENQDLTIPNSIDVSGGWDPSFTAPGSSTYITTVHLPITDNIDVSGNSDHSELSHFTLEITGARTSRMQGIYVLESEVTIDSVSVTVVNNKEEAVGIHIVTTDAAANVTISNSEIVARSPDHPDNNPFEAYSYGLWIRDNTFSTGGEASSSVTVTSTDITTESRNGESYAVHLDDFTGTASFDGGTWNPTASAPGIFSLKVRGLFQRSNQDSDVTIENVTINGNYASGHDSMGIQITGNTAGSTFTATNNTITGSKWGLITNSFVNGALTVTGNTIELDDTPDGSGIFPETFGLSLADRSNTVVRDNYIDVASGALFAVGIDVDKPEGTLLVANNVIWRRDDGGAGNFTGIDFEHSQDAVSEIFHNTIVESRSSPAQSRAVQMSVGLPDFINNLISGGFSITVYEGATSQGPVNFGLFQNNHLEAAGTTLYLDDDGGTFYSSTTAIEANVGSTASGNVTALATGFADGVNGDFDLTASSASALRQGGLDLSGSLDTDFDGITRSTGGSNGASFSIGAFEY